MEEACRTACGGPAERWSPARRQRPLAALSLLELGQLMPRKKKRRARVVAPRAAQLPGTGIDVEASLLDVVDNVLNKGMVLNGDLILGVANVDLIYARVSVLLAALDKIGEEAIFRPVKPARRKRARPSTRR